MNPLRLHAGPRPAPRDVLLRLHWPKVTPLSTTIHPFSNNASYATNSTCGAATSQMTSSLQAIVHRTSFDRRPLAHSLRNYTYSSKSASLYSTETLARQPIIHDVFETETGTWQYIVADPATLDAVIIDPVLDFDRATQAIRTVSADRLFELVKKKGYKIVCILETHAHADHITAASYLQRYLESEVGYRPTVGIGKRIGQVQTCFGPRYGVPITEYEGVFDKFFEDDETFSIGNLQATAIHLPGHTPDHLGYKIGDNVFCGDSLFHVDIGTARCDFPGGSANKLYHSGRKLLSLPDHVKIWTGHDYPPEGRAKPVSWMTVRDHKRQNKHLREGITEQQFVAQRKVRDANLGEPKLLHQSLQMNIRGGQLPKPSPSGHRMLQLPLKLRGLQW